MVFTPNELSARPHLCSLPYDIRHLIYQHVFPSGQQIYVQAFGSNGLQSIHPQHGIPIESFRACRLLNDEASGFLYNNYLFNIIGLKKDCLAAYEAFVHTAQKYARREVRVHAFSNGTHSKTMCISVHAGDGKLGIVERRERGVLKDISELEHEVFLDGEEESSVSSYTKSALRALNWRFVLALMCVVLALTLGRSNRAWVDW